MASKLFDLTGKVALITGATRGIGKGIAQEMARSGAKVAVCARTAEDCKQVAAELEASFLPPPPQAIAYHLLQWWLER